MMTHLNKILCLFLLTLLPLLSSCGGKGQKKTKAELKLFGGMQIDGNPAFAGGAFVFGQSDSGDNLAINIFSDTQEVSLKNGIWQFWVIGWAGPDPLTGNNICGLGSAELGGGSQTVNIITNAAVCADPSFGDPANWTGTNFKPLRLTNCLTLSGLVDSTSDCSGNTSNISSYRISLAMFNGPGIPINGFFGSLCIPEAGNPTGHTTTNITLPIGSSALAPFLATEIQAFSGPGCTETPQNFFSDAGLFNLPNSNTAMYPDASVTALYLRSGFIPNQIAAIDSQTSAAKLTSTSYKINARVNKNLKTETLSSSSYKFDMSANPTTPTKRTINSAQYIFQMGMK